MLDGRVHIYYPKMLACSKVSVFTKEELKETEDAVLPGLTLPSSVILGDTTDYSGHFCKLIFFIKLSQAWPLIEAFKLQMWFLNGDYEEFIPLALVDRELSSTELENIVKATLSQGGKVSMVEPIFPLLTTASAPNNIAERVRHWIEIKMKTTLFDFQGFHLITEFVNRVKGEDARQALLQCVSHQRSMVKSFVKK